MKNTIIDLVIAIFFAALGVCCVAKAMIMFNESLIPLLLCGIVFFAYGLNCLAPSQNEEEVD